MIVIIQIYLESLHIRLSRVGYWRESKRPATHGGHQIHMSSIDFIFRVVGFFC